MKLVKFDSKNEYSLYQIDSVVENKKEWISDCYKAFFRFNVLFPDSSSTWKFRDYNTFNLTAGSLLFYDLFKKLKTIIREFENSDDPLWMQSWINFHSAEEVLNMHNHVDSKFHGYLNIEPFNTTTSFSDYAIQNKTGLLYIGPSYKFHEVIVNEPFDKKRITIGFDVLNVSNTNKILIQDKNQLNLSLMPI